MLAGAGKRGTLFLLDGHTGKYRWKKKEKSPVTRLAFSPDNKTLFIGNKNGELMLLDAETGRISRIWHGHQYEISAVAYSKDGRLLASAGKEGFVRVWDQKTGRDIHSTPGHTGPVYYVTCSPDGRFVLSCGSDHTTRLWSALTGSEIRSFATEHLPRSPTFAANGTACAWIGYGRPHWLSLATTAEVVMRGDIVGPCICLTPSSDGRSVYCVDVYDRLVNWVPTSGIVNRRHSFSERIGFQGRESISSQATVAGALKADGRFLHYSTRSDKEQILQLYCPWPSTIYCLNAEGTMLLSFDTHPVSNRTGLRVWDLCTKQ